MRIIGGTHKGRILNPPKGLQLRPTTDFAKESLFNILSNKIDFEGIRVLELFCGTGNLTFELASRGCGHITAIDKDTRCVKYISQQAKDFSFSGISVSREDVFRFLKTCNTQFDLIIADPPYDLANIEVIHELIVENKLLQPKGVLVIEHGAKTDLSTKAQFLEKRKYGSVNFSFFQF